VSTRYIIFSVFLLLSQIVFAQKQSAIWYFGMHAGLDFNSGNPVPATGGQIYTIEGVASICNSNGQLLFYTEGVTVWNRLHHIMPNGTGLEGHASSTQSAIIVPVIGDTSRFYVFTIGDYGSNQGLHYSIVNMNLDSGRGSIETKNIPLKDSVSEKLTAVRHCNGRDIWIITHSTFFNYYYAFLVDPSGVHTAPVISQTGTPLLGASVGYLKASPNGKKLAAAFWTRNADLCDFDNITGTVSNAYKLLPETSDTTYRTYGVEFSPDGRLLYLSTGFFVSRRNGDHLLQYDVSLPTPAAVKASKQIIAEQLMTTNFAALQIALDEKIYMVKSTVKEIAAITNPNAYGPGCNYVSAAIHFGDNQNTTSGLPNFIQSYFFKRDSFTCTSNCPGKEVSFRKPPLSAGETFVWDFGDPSSGANNTSTLESPTHIYTSSGQHLTQLIIYTPCGTDTLRRNVPSYDLKLNLGADTLICSGNDLLLHVSGNESYQYRWQNGSSDPTFTVTSAGMYWVEIKNPLGCTLRDSIRIDYDRVPAISLGADQSICPGNMVYLNPQLDTSWQIQWQDGSTDREYKVVSPGLYTLQAANGCGIVHDEIVFSKGICKVTAPSAFTPNGDGKNDFFKILGTETVASLHLRIFNRWGEVVFETKDKSKGWNGIYMGKLAPTEVYVYLVEFKDANSVNEQILKGNFVLIR
jgi:gliding motility-associated-like protein